MTIASISYLQYLLGWVWSFSENNVIRVGPRKKINHYTIFEIPVYEMLKLDKCKLTTPSTFVTSTSSVLKLPYFWYLEMRKNFCSSPLSIISYMQDIRIIHLETRMWEHLQLLAYFSLAVDAKYTLNLQGSFGKRRRNIINILYNRQ